MDAIHGTINGHSRCRGGLDTSEFGKNGPDSASLSDSLIRVEYDGVVFWRNMFRMSSYTFKRNENNDNRKERLEVCSYQQRTIRPSNREEDFNSLVRPNLPPE